jgi:hypothetical protein
MHSLIHSLCSLHPVHGGGRQYLVLVQYSKSSDDPSPIDALPAETHQSLVSCIEAAIFLSKNMEAARGNERPRRISRIRMRCR